jgi:hypothetical protein
MRVNLRKISSRSQRIRDLCCRTIRNQSWAVSVPLACPAGRQDGNARPSRISIPRGETAVIRHFQERRLAETALTPSAKTDFIDMERRWLSLAHNYEFAEWLSRPSRKDKRQKE